VVEQWVAEQIARQMSDTFERRSTSALDPDLRGFCQHAVVTLGRDRGQEEADAKSGYRFRTSRHAFTSASLQHELAHRGGFRPLILGGAL
jgi:hypothetical protein